MKQQQQQQATKRPREKALDSYTPSTYMAYLEGTLLANGDLKGSWRVRREDEAQNDFCMILVGRGLYDGAFNIQVPQPNASAPSVLDISDKWHSFEWVETTQPACNVWGRGQNTAFGEFFTIGVHDPTQRRIVIYKVCEKEMLRAQAFARIDNAAVAPVTAKPGPDHAAAAVPAPPTITAPAQAAVPAAAVATRATAEAPPAAVLTPRGGTRQRSRGFASSRPADFAAAGGIVAAAHASSRSDIVTAAALLIQAATGGGGGGGGGGSGSGSGGGSRRGGGCCQHAGARSPGSSDGDACGGGGGGGGGGSGGSDTMSEEGSGGGPALGGCRTTSRPVAKMPKPSEDAPLPAPVPIPTEGPVVQMRPAFASITSTFSLPGFSGRFDDASTTSTTSGGGAHVAGASADELADLSILGARLQKEKLKIQEAARARRQPLLQEKGRFGLDLQKGEEDEAVMLRAIQELRKKMAEDGQRLESATRRLQSVDEEERNALLLWNHKWETKVAPFIAQCEQGVKRKAQELEKKTRQAQLEREELERERQRLQSVKLIGDLVLPTNLHA